MPGKKNFVTRFCPMCGKEFYPTPEHVYTDSRKRMYCSWTCFNHRDDHKVKPIKKHKHVALIDEKGNIIQIFISAKSAADHAVDAYESSIYEACRTGQPYKGRRYRYITESEMEE